MTRFSIKELERFSGVKAHTIRIWELRFKLFSPERSLGNVRRYSLHDVRRLMNIALLQKNGCRISVLAQLDAVGLDQKLQELVEMESRQCSAINHLILYMYHDIEKFEDVLDSCVLYWGIDVTIKKIILPFLEKTELLSYKDKSCETHFAVTAIRKKIIYGIENRKDMVPASTSALLFLPEGEHYDLFLLYMTYILKQKGIRVLYLGTDISAKNLNRIIEEKKPDLLFTYITNPQRFKLHGFAAQLDCQHPGIKAHVVSYQSPPSNQEINNLQFIPHQVFDSFVESLC
jgi:DNA-binding transcriptional MerR regulator